MQYIENRTFDEIQVGDTAELTRTLKASDIELFSVMSGNSDADAEQRQTDPFHRVITHGMWGGALISAVLGAELPGPGTIYLNQSLRFLSPVGVGDTVTIRITVQQKFPDKKVVKLACECTNQDGQLVIEGEIEVIAPTQKVRRPRTVVPEMHLHERGAQYQEFIAATRELKPIRTAVVHPCDELSITAAVEAKSQGLIDPVLIGPKGKIESAASAAKINIDGMELIDVPHSHAAAGKAVELVRQGSAEAIMKGKLHTDELMQAVIDRDNGLRTERRMSHIFVFDVPHYPKPLFITDAAINICPDPDTKRDIVQNAIDLAHSLGISEPKVAILSAVETVNSKIASTLDAAALCKMADRGQIVGGLLDGPLAFDNAISKSASKTKGIVSKVAGDADILLVPDLESGNMLAKQLVYLAGADSAGIVIGARVPIILTSRADDLLSRLASCALALIFVHYRATTKLKLND